MMKKNRYMVLICALFYFLAISCTRMSQPEYIAHAGGNIDGYAYTNSLEAVDHALSHDVNCIELDLCITADSNIVAAHDWEYFHEITGHAGDTAAVSLNEFCQRKIHDKYTPITFAMIDSLMTVHPNMYLVTDKISSPPILSRFTHRDRIMVEAFGLNDYYQLDTMGFYKIFYSSSPKSYKKAFNKWVKRVLNQPSSPVPTRYTFWLLGQGHADNTKDYWYAYGKEFAVFSVKDRHEADSLAALDSRIKYVYIDEVE